MSESKLLKNLPDGIEVSDGSIAIKTNIDKLYECEPQTIYVVTAGSYSDYHIEAVFSTKELADLYASTITDADVEEYTLDEITTRMQRAKNGFFFYHVNMRMDGDDAEARLENSDKCLDGEFWVRYHSLVWRKPQSFYITGFFYARSQEHAIKILNEIRVQLIANGWDNQKIDYKPK